MKPSVSAVIIVSQQPKRLVEFYSQIFSLNFESDSHGKLTTHYFSLLNQLRIIIHPSSNYPDVFPQPGAISFAISVKNIDNIHKTLIRHNVLILTNQKETFGHHLRFRDPDENIIHVVQLNPS